MDAVTEVSGGTAGKGEPHTGIVGAGTVYSKPEGIVVTKHELYRRRT